MSRYYTMAVTITGAGRDRVDAVKQAAEAEWPFGEWFLDDGVLTASADDRLCGGESEEQFAERLAKEIWTCASQKLRPRYPVRSYVI